MPAVTITLPDLQALNADIVPATAQALIPTALARAAQVAPCILAADFAFPDAAKGVIVDVILRRAEGGSGALQSVTVDSGSSYTVNAQLAGVLFRPGEIAELQALCKATARPLPMAVFPEPPVWRF